MLRLDRPEHYFSSSSSSSSAGSSQPKLISDGRGHTMGSNNGRSLAAENSGNAPKGKRKLPSLMLAHPPTRVFIFRPGRKGVVVPPWNSINQTNRLA
jgi:hypothetical protein